MANMQMYMLLHVKIQQARCTCCTECLWGNYLQCMYGKTMEVLAYLGGLKRRRGNTTKLIARDTPTNIHESFTLEYTSL